MILSKASRGRPRGPGKETELYLIKMAKIIAQKGEIKLYTAARSVLRDAHILPQQFGNKQRSLVRSWKRYGAEYLKLEKTKSQIRNPALGRFLDARAGLFTDLPIDGKISNLLNPLRLNRNLLNDSDLLDYLDIVETFQKCDEVRNTAQLIEKSFLQVGPNGETAAEMRGISKRGSSLFA
ncbi:MAG: hypothetical protein AAGH53_10975 [Pseudomonadota bacterium]